MSFLKSCEFIRVRFISTEEINGSSFRYSKMVIFKI